MFQGVLEHGARVGFGQSCCVWALLGLPCWGGPCPAPTPSGKMGMFCQGKDFQPINTAGFS